DRVLHLERRAISLPWRRLAALLHERRHAAGRRAQHLHPFVLQQRRHPQLPVPDRTLPAAGPRTTVTDVAEPDAGSAGRLPGGQDSELSGCDRIVAPAVTEIMSC